MNVILSVLAAVFMVIYSLGLMKASYEKGYVTASEQFILLIEEENKRLRGEGSCGGIAQTWERMQCGDLGLQLVEEGR